MCDICGKEMRTAYGYKCLIVCSECFHKKPKIKNIQMGLFNEKIIFM